MAYGGRIASKRRSFMEGVVRYTLGRRGDNLERWKQPAKLGSNGRKTVRDFSRV
jgi:hypothetical protein